MDNTLIMYPNLQYNPIKIPDFTILEIYKDKIETTNGLGYCIIPIEGLTNQEIRNKAKAKADLVQPSGYTNYILLTGGKENDFNHKIVYAIWYQGEVPSYPNEPKVIKLTPEPPHNIWHEIEVNNAAAATYITITLTCSAFGHLEFYVNDDYFAIDINKPILGVNQIIISKDGVIYNDRPLDSFKMSSAPKLKAGMNHIRVNSANISKIDISYKQKY